MMNKSGSTGKIMGAKGDPIKGSTGVPMKSLAARKAAGKAGAKGKEPKRKPLIGMTRGKQGET